MNITLFLCSVFGLVGIAMILLGKAFLAPVLIVMGIFILIPITACGVFHLVRHYQDK